MTTNQTIDGVPRVDLESICEHFEAGRHWQAVQGVQKLRALLDAPVAAALTDEQILEAMRPAIYAADGGYVFDTAPEHVIAAGRAILALSAPAGLLVLP